MEMGQQVLNKDSNESRDLLKPWKVYPKCWMQIL